MPRSGYKIEAIECALYARFSNKTVQNDSSIEDQFASLEHYAPRLNLKPVKKHYYCDRGISGSDALEDRPGISINLIGAIERGEIKALLVEHTDRLSRFDSDLLLLKNIFKHYGVKVFTINGEVSDFQWTFDSHGNADFSAKLASRVKRGHDAMAEKRGRIPGPLAYGYDLADPTRTDLTKRGLWVRNEDEIKVLTRIFTEYAAAMTPQQICNGLMKDGILSPTGKKHWSKNSIVGGIGHGRGLLHNRIYIGEYVRNRFTAPKHPVTRKRQVRAQSAEDLMVVAMPEHRIISDELWNAAHAVRLQRQRASGHTIGKKLTARKQGIFSGLLVCGACFGQMTVSANNIKGQRVACRNATHFKTCSHSKSYDLARLTDGTLDRVQERLTNPILLKEEAKAHAMEEARLEREGKQEREKTQADLDRIKIRIKKLVDLWTDPDLGGSDEIKAQIKTAEAEKSALTERLNHMPSESNVTPLHSAKLESTCRDIDRACNILLAGKTDDPEYPQAVLGLRNIVRSIVVIPTPKKADYVIDLFRRRSVIESGINLFPAGRSLKEIVQKEGVRLFNKEQTVTSVHAISNNDLVLIGRFALAA